MNICAASILSAGAKLAQTRVSGLPISIEHPRGTVRELKNKDGATVYKKFMHHHYGFLNKTTGRDGDEVDVFVGPLKNPTEAYIVHMKDLGPDVKQREDEDKCFLGFPSANAAKQAFLQHYPATFYDGMTALPIAQFKQRMKTASLPYRRKKITAKRAEFFHRFNAAVKKAKCPGCGSKKFVLMPTDFETAKCKDCGKNFDINVEK